MDGIFITAKVKAQMFFCSEYCPAPSFDLFIDDFPIADEDDGAHRDIRPSKFAEHESMQYQVPPQPVIEIIDDDFAMDLEGIDEAYAHVQEKDMEFGAGCLVGNIYQTPEKVSNQGEVGSGSKIYSSSSSGEMVSHHFERRIIKPPPCKRSPFMDYNEKKVYMCKPEANRLYASVILHGRLDEEASPDADTSPKVIDYNVYYVTVRELANSMKKEGFVLTHEMEIDIQSIMMNLPPDSKKVVMPLRFSTRLQQMHFPSKDMNSKELISRFNKSNRLDRKDMIMFPVLENIDKSKPVTGNHYWVFNVNIRDRKFEVLDSWRTLKDKGLDDCARTMVASFRALWEEHYAKSHVSMDYFELTNVDVPKQTNEFDCGILALTLANGWEARNVPRFTTQDVPNIRKKLTNTWVNTVHNKAPWKDVLKLA